MNVTFFLVVTKRDYKQAYFTAGADHYKRDDVNKFYNSLKLLGEYFNKARNANGSPINILGQSLLNLLNLELEKELKTLFHLKNDSFSELILTQVRHGALYYYCQHAHCYGYFCFRWLLMEIS